MTRRDGAGRLVRLAICLGLALATAGCARLQSLNPFGGADDPAPAESSAPAPAAEPQETRETIWDLVRERGDAATTVRVNRYLWFASLDVLSFLPVETVDPFTGVIVTGFGTPPGGSRAYRATVLISDPALDARSLRLALIGRDGGAVDAATIRALEDAILTRARELRTRDARL
ncbi:MAG: DUF3576 domain-containing protein [Alphaproteobacteria bacterium]|nr:DUF3576 domain-containing protein [Alphaproteobacteria bacterium]